MLIRWLGAFRGKGWKYSLSEVFEYELSCSKIKAAEDAVKGKSHIHQARIGLLVNKRAIVRKYQTDVWSEYDVHGNLRPSRGEYKTSSIHKECFVKPDYIGVVIKGRGEIKQEHLDACFALGLPVYRLFRNGTMVPYSREED